MASRARKSGSKSAKSRQFAFKQSKDLEVEANEPIKFEGYEEFFQQLEEAGKGKIVDYIMEEAKGVQKQRENDVSDFEGVG